MIEIRRLQSFDKLDDLIILPRLFFDEYQDHDERFFNIDILEDEHIISFFKRTIDSENSATFMAVAAKKIVAYITVSVQNEAPFYQVKRCGTISGLMVLPEYRGRGIGRQLLDAALSYFKDNGLKYYKLFTSVNNQTAIQFYESYGLKHFQTIMLGTID